MKKPKLEWKRTDILVPVNDVLLDHLRMLLGTGLFGKTLEEVAERMMCKGLELTLNSMGAAPVIKGRQQ